MTHSPPFAVDETLALVLRTREGLSRFDGIELDVIEDLEAIADRPAQVLKAMAALPEDERVRTWTRFVAQGASAIGTLLRRTIELESQGETDRLARTARAGVRAQQAVARIAHFTADRISGRKVEQ